MEQMICFRPVLPLTLNSKHDISKSSFYKILHTVIGEGLNILAFFRHSNTREDIAMLAKRDTEGC